MGKRKRRIEEKEEELLSEQLKKSGNWIEKTWTGGFHLRMWRTWMHRIVPNWEVSELHLQTVDW